MTEKQAKYISWGCTVEHTDTEGNTIAYVLISDTPCEDGTFKLIKERQKDLYHTYKAWERNGILKEADKERLDKMPVYLPYTELKPIDLIRLRGIRDGKHVDLFNVPNFGTICVKEEHSDYEQNMTLSYIDATHFEVVGGSVWHIDQWAEISANRKMVCTLCEG